MLNIKLYFLIIMIFFSSELISQPLLTSDNIISNNIVSNNITSTNSDSKTSHDLTTSHALNVSHDLAIQDRPDTNSVKLTPFSNLWGNITESFTGWDNILLQLAGVASTFAISSSNLDNHISTYFRDHESYKNYASPAVILGSTLPITTGAFLYIYGKLHDDNRMVGASFAVFQAGLITVTYISILKGLTGRAHPDPNDAPLDRGDVSRRFNFGLVRGGIYRGWPSGHVGGTMAVASSLSNYYSEKTWLKALTYFWVGYTMASVSIYHKGTMHWFSDAIAAGFMTYSIGKSVGNFYRNSISENPDHEKFRLWPVQIDDYSGVFLSYSF